MLFRIILLTLISIQIQAQTGTISGRIVDKKTGESMIGGIVKIINTNLGAATDLDGKFTIKNIPIGNYQVVISAVSYEKDTQNITVKAGQNTEVNATLGSASIQKKEVVITKKRNKESLTALAVIQKNSIMVADGISSDVIKKSPDRNTGDVIKRVSGASLQEGKFAIVRGLADRYNNAMLNNVLLSSTEADRKAFSFDLVPASAIDNLMIFKTASPDISGDFAGGIIQITTKDIPEERYTSLSLGVNYNGLSTFKPFVAQQETAWDFLGLTNGNRNLPDLFPNDNQYNYLTNSEKYAVTKTFANSFPTVKIPAAMPGGSFQLTNAWNTKKEKFEAGSIFSVNYSNNYRINPLERKSFDAIAVQEYESNEEQYRHTNGLGGIWNIGLKFGQNHKLSFLNLFNNNSESLVVSRGARDITSNDSIRQTIQQFTKNTLQSHQISGENCIGTKCYRLKYQAGINILSKSTPDLRRTFYSYDLTNPDDTIFSAYAPYSADPRSGGRFFSNLKEYSFYGGADMTIPFTLFTHKQSLKFGLYEQVKTRKFTTNVLGYVIANGSQFNDAIRDMGEDKIYDSTNIGNHGFVLRETYNPEDRYRALSNLFAGFAMLDNKFSDHWRLAWGLRVEQFGQELYIPTKTGDTMSTRHIYIDFLPSANLIYSFNDRSNLRFSLSKTLSRPEFRELSLFRFYDYSSNATIGGNPDLQRSNIYNADVRYEIFQKNGQMFTFSGFFKYFDMPIEQTVDFTGPETRVKSFVNAKSAISYGAETEFRLKLSTIFNKPDSKILNSFLLTCNAALIYSKVNFPDSLTYVKARALQGQSPYVVNASVQYTSSNSLWTASIFYNVVGDRISEVGNDAAGKPNVIEKHRHIVDLQLGRKLGKRADIKLTANDIFAQKSIYYIDFTSLNVQKDFISQKNAPTFNFTFSYKF